jgi:hypothetical protein
VTRLLSPAPPPGGTGLIAGYIARWRPSSVSGEAARFARQVGAGAGLTGADLRAVRGTDVACRSGGVVVEVRGARPRAVPLLSRYHDILLASAEFAGSGLVTAGPWTDSSACRLCHGQ